jgi:hypothetical protein
VGWGLWGDVVEGKDVVVFENLVARNIAAQDFGENVFGIICHDIFHW